MSDVKKQLTPKDAPLHRVFLVDLHEPLVQLGTAIHNYCLDNEALFTTKDLLMMALNFLSVTGTVNEAAEAMMIEVKVFQGDLEVDIDDAKETEIKTEYATNVMYEAILTFMRNMHEIFTLNHFYGEDGHLQYTFGGWQDEEPLPEQTEDPDVKHVAHRKTESYVPYFIPLTHVKYYPKAKSHVVQGEPKTKSGRQWPSDEKDLDLPF